MKDGTAPAHILVVEDNPTVRDGLEQILRRVGHEVTAVQDAVAALRHCQEEPVDLVITDFKMEGMTGLELLETLINLRRYDKESLRSIKEGKWRKRGGFAKGYLLDEEPVLSSR